MQRDITIIDSCDNEASSNVPGGLESCIKKIEMQQELFVTLEVMRY